MIPASYLMKSLYRDRFGDPAQVERGKPTRGGAHRGFLARLLAAYQDRARKGAWPPRSDFTIARLGAHKSLA